MKQNILLPIVAALFCLVSCDPDNHQHPDVLFGTWASVANEKSGTLFLDIDDLNISVRNGSWDFRPFTDDGMWNYYMTRDSVLCISREYYDGDEYSSESYDLDLSFSNSFNTLTLYYDPLIGSARKYTFIRR